ncbi:Hypothetical_protein [Hexamita inflata]|uniref:Hypothetical_protein n=1 Tax=Hexamita inflata TaxID=28002 RepID=A0AA86PYR7_9EUKA|nr:Hypothetical protein HINF_LOCUS31067 [Hexamita inflata]CAI9943427.1 Hypothetical protein HINF_LOCUS31072 [Hexamita inflata]
MKRQEKTNDQYRHNLRQYQYKLLKYSAHSASCLRLQISARCFLRLQFRAVTYSNSVNVRKPKCFRVNNYYIKQSSARVIQLNRTTNVVLDRARENVLIIQQYVRKVSCVAIIQLILKHVTDYLESFLLEYF